MIQSFPEVECITARDYLSRFRDSVRGRLKLCYPRDIAKLQLLKDFPNHTAWAAYPEVRTGGTTLETMRALAMIYHTGEFGTTMPLWLEFTATKFVYELGLENLYRFMQDEGYSYYESVLADEELNTDECVKELKFKTCMLVIEEDPRVHPDLYI